MSPFVTLHGDVESLAESTCFRALRLAASSLEVRYAGPSLYKQEGNVLQEPAAAMHQMFPLKRLYNVSTKSVPGSQCFQN